MRLLLFPLTFLWQLPQNLIALVFALIWLIKGDKLTTEAFRGVTIFWVATNSKFSGVSLGNFIFIRSGFEKYSIHVKAHEFGHCVQSMFFGPLYLLVIGLPSVTRAWWTTVWYAREIRKAEAQHEIDNKPWRTGPIIEKINAWYYAGYPESWADKLGGVTRS